MTIQESDLDTIDALVSRRRSRRPWIVIAVLIIAAVIAVAAWLLTRPEEEIITAEPQRIVATLGRLTTTIELSGSAAAANSAGLNFAVGGTVSSIEVEVGQTVQAGDVLAALEDEAAARRLETAQLQLRLAEITLEELLDDPAAAELAAAERAVSAADAQVASAELALRRISDPPSDSDVRQAEQAVANARTQLSNAQEALDDLSDGPDAADLASAEQAVASARNQLSSAEGALSDLRDGPTAADLASAEQAVANARQQLSSAEEALSDLKQGPTAAEIAAAEQAVASARNQRSNARQALTDLQSEPSEAELASARAAVTTARGNSLTAERQRKDALLQVEDTHENFCNQISAAPAVCTASLPLSADLIDLLEAEVERSGSFYVRLARAVLNADAAHTSAQHAEAAARDSLQAAESRLSDLTEPADTNDIYQAEQAVEAAESNFEAAQARLDELMTPASIDDLFQAEQAAAAAQASLDAAQARLDDLNDGVDADDLFQAEQAVAAAQASYDAASARLSDLRAGPDAQDRYQAEQTLAAAQANADAMSARLAELLEPAADDELRQAESNLASANASYEEAVSRRDELLDGSSVSAIDRQQQNVRLAQIAVEEAEDALDDLIIRAQFDGVIEEINIEVGDRVSAGAAAMVLSTRGQIVIELTVTEAEWFDLKPDAVGLAGFDALDDLIYAIRVSEAGRVPRVDQGVVTYAVEAAILTPEELTDVSDQLAAIGGEGAVTVGEQGASGGGGGGLSPQARRALDAFAAMVTLPPGVDIIDVVRAIAFDEDLPEGVILPDGFSVPEPIRARLRQAFEDAERQAAEREAGGVETPLPAPGMSATVTIITEIRPEAVLVSTSAVRQIDGQFYVAVPSGEIGWERVPVSIGRTDGANVEIMSGIQAGDVVLIGADSEGIAYSATQLSGGGAPGGGLPGGGGG